MQLVSYSRPALPLATYLVSFRLNPGALLTCGEPRLLEQPFDGQHVRFPRRDTPESVCRGMHA
jgi:hypothetical protein